MTKLEYKPIPQPSGGKICLSIEPPGRWFGEEAFVVFVGGCGVGQRKTRADAEELLRQKTVEDLGRRIEHAKAEAAYYENQLDQFVLHGLCRVTPTKPERRKR